MGQSAKFAFSSRRSSIKLKVYLIALADFNKVILLTPDNASGYNNRGFTYSNLGEYQRAISDYSKAIEIDSNYADAYGNRGLVYHELNL